MKSNSDHLKTSKSNPESKLNAQDDLKTISMPELEKKLVSSSEGLTQDEAKKRLTQYGPNEIEEKKINHFLNFLPIFGGPFHG